jgi:phosphopantothenoylcysteine decarboxylase / phosphopantothenate---cysteine ligase
MHFLITAGGTREYIDPVRFISNASTGKMGYALARAALGHQHTVTLITAPTGLKPPARAETIHVNTSRDMFQAVKTSFPDCDCLVMAAAVSDYTVVRPAKTKIKKARARFTLDLKPTQDILKWAGQRKSSTAHPAQHRKKLIVGFALEDRTVRDHAEKKLHDKQLDMIVANTPAAIGANQSALQIKIQGQEWLDLPMGDKAMHAKRIVRLIRSLVDQT